MDAHSRVAHSSARVECMAGARRCKALSVYMSACLSFSLSLWVCVCAPSTPFLSRLNPFIPPHFIRNTQRIVWPCYTRFLRHWLVCAYCVVSLDSFHHLPILISLYLLPLFNSALHFSWLLSILNIFFSLLLYDFLTRFAIRWKCYEYFCVVRSTNEAI